VNLVGTFGRSKLKLEFVKIPKNHEILHGILN